MPRTIPPEISHAIQRIDAAVADWPEDLLAEWRKVRGYCRSKHSDSHRILPAASLVAQEIAQSRNHAQAALDAMAEVFGGGAGDDEPETKKIKKTPEDR